MLAQLSKTVFLTLIFLLLALLVGSYFSLWVGWAVFCAGLVLQMGFHFRNFARLDRWSRNPVVDASLEGKGEWDNIFGRLYRHEKSLRQKIASSEHEVAMLIAATQALTDGVVLLDKQNHILFCNKTAESQLGLLWSVDNGQSILNLVRQPEFVGYIKCGDFSQPLLLRPERFRDRLYAMYFIPYAGSRHLIQIKDITSADRLDQMRRDFVANVSHELRTPLTVLVGFLETMQSIALSEDDHQKYLAMMTAQAERMQAIVQDLLTLSVIESASPPEDQTIDMKALLDKLCRDAEALSAGRHTIRFAIVGEGDLRGSEQELTGAFTNLVANAVRYTPEGGVITVQWSVSSQGAAFSVSDTGLGIEPQHLPRLTERFYRVEKGRSRDSGGTGLGLAIVKHALNRHQAQLDIKSEVGKGSCFTARFPTERVA